MYRTLSAVVISFAIAGFYLNSTVASAWDYPDPTYGTGDPPNYKKKGSSKKKGNSHRADPYVYSSRFNDPSYGTSNPPGYNEKKAKQMGKIYVPPKAEVMSPVYGTGVPDKPSSRRRR